MISGFNLKRSKKFAKWAAVQKYQKQILELWYLHYSHFQGCQGCQKIQKTKLKITLVTWSTKIQLKLNKIRKTFRKQGFSDNFCSILTFFHNFFNFGWILELQMTRVYFSLATKFIDTPGTPWGMSIVEWTNFSHLDQCVWSYPIWFWTSRCKMMAFIIRFTLFYRL